MSVPRDGKLCAYHAGLARRADQIAPDPRHADVLAVWIDDRCAEAFKTTVKYRQAGSCCAHEDDDL